MKAEVPGIIEFFTTEGSFLWTLIRTTLFLCLVRDL
jgi:hypothetical protein